MKQRLFKKGPKTITITTVFRKVWRYWGSYTHTLSQEIWTSKNCAFTFTLISLQCCLRAKTKYSKKCWRLSSRLSVLYWTLQTARRFLNWDAAKSFPSFLTFKFHKISWQTSQLEFMDVWFRTQPTPTALPWRLIFRFTQSMLSTASYDMISSSITQPHTSVTSSKFTHHCWKSKSRSSSVWKTCWVNFSHISSPTEIISSICFPLCSSSIMNLPPRQDKVASTIIKTIKTKIKTMRTQMMREENPQTIITSIQARLVLEQLDKSYRLLILSSKKMIRFTTYSFQSSQSLTFFTLKKVSTFWTRSSSSPKIWNQSTTFTSVWSFTESYPWMQLTSIT